MELSKWRLGYCVLLLLTLANPLHSAVVANDKVLEMVLEARQAIFDVVSLENNTGRWNQLESSLVSPLRLQLAVLETTDSLNREMSSSSWQAMLRALGGDREILTRFSKLGDDFSVVEKQLAYGQSTEQFNTLSKSSHSLWSRLWPQLETLVTTVTDLYDWFSLYQRNSAAVNERTLNDYAQLVHGKDGLTAVKALHLIHKTVCPETNSTRLDTNDLSHCHTGIFQAFANVTQDSDSSICSTGKSAHQLVYDLYTLLALTEAKGYAVMQFSWMLLRLYGKGNFTTESQIARGDFERRMIEKAHAAQQLLSQLPTWMWKCDTTPDKHGENLTYIEFTEVLQGYVVNEVDMNHDNTCKDSCSAYTNTQEKSCFSDREFCAKKQRRCTNGRIYDCRFIEADSTVCISQSSGRRYDWIDYKSGRFFGKAKTTCNGSGQSLNTVNSWWRWFVHCSYCTCLCDQPGFSSDRYVSLMPSLADTDANHLVTGLRFVKIDRIVHIQIQEAQALPRGFINVSTTAWKAVNPVAIPQFLEESVLDGPGYATLRYEERAVDLDDLMAPNDHVVTGVRLRKLGGHLNLEIRVSPIDFVTGQIDGERAFWISNDRTPVTEDNARTKLYIHAGDVPTHSPIPSVPDSWHNQYVEFQATSLEKDISQTTVPFLDAHDVLSQSPTWLTGIGIYHKGQAGYGGFLAFRLATLDFSNHMILPSALTDHTVQQVV